MKIDRKLCELESLMKHLLLVNIAFRNFVYKTQQKYPEL